MPHNHSALSNRKLIVEQLTLIPLPDAKHALEVASGSGAHIEVYAPAFPQLTWQPSEVEGVQHIDEFGTAMYSNVLPAVYLNAVSAEWPSEVQVHAGDYALVVCSNFCHIAPWEATLCLFRGSAVVLAAGGWLCISGAFMPFPSEGEALQADLKFDAGLRTHDPRCGARALEDVEAVAVAAGFVLQKRVVMPQAMFFLGFQLKTQSGGGSGNLESRTSSSRIAVRTWPELRKESGSVAPRPFECQYRLFGAREPEVLFWRDDSAWCPYCCKIWLLLELMEVPFEIKTVPLRAYMRPGATKDPAFLAMIPSGVVPALQFRVKDGSFAMALGHPAVNNRGLFAELESRYPEKYPWGDPRVFEIVCGAGGVVDGFENARRAYESCAGAPCPHGALGTGLREACVALDMVLEASGGPFINGDQLTAPDCHLLPLLERAEAVVPYYFGKTVLDVIVPFAKARRMLQVARSKTFFGEIASDATTLGRMNIVYAPRGFNADTAVAAEIDGMAEEVSQNWLLAARGDTAARRDAAARLVRNHDAVGCFAQRSSGGGHVHSQSHAEALNMALQLVTESLLSAEVPNVLLDSVRAAALALRDTHEVKATTSAADALESLALKIGVPRDMAEAPARALRSHLRLVAGQLRQGLERVCGECGVQSVQGKSGLPGTDWASRWFCNRCWNVWEGKLM